MKAIAQIDQNVRAVAGRRSFALDTTFVLFFLAVEFGQSESLFSMDTGLVAATLGMVMAVPYFLNADEEKPEFRDWLMGRAFIALFAAVIGLMFKQALGTVLPETLRFLPMTLLILSAMLSCYIQFYSFLKFRLAK